MCPDAMDEMFVDVAFRSGRPRGIYGAWGLFSFWDDGRAANGAADREKERGSEEIS